MCAVKRRLTQIDTIVEKRDVAADSGINRNLIFFPENFGQFSGLLPGNFKANFKRFTRSHRINFAPRFYDERNIVILRIGYS